MAEPKPLASLNAGLLARKGAAQPAMRRPMLGFGRAVGSAAQQEDLGWNDMGFDIPMPESQPVETPVVVGLTPMGASAPAPVPPVVIEREALAERIADVAPQPRAAVGPTSGRKAAFTLRIDADRHLKLRLACAITGRSAQMIVTEALDAFLNNLPEIDRLTQQLPHMRGGQ